MQSSKRLAPVLNLAVRDEEKAAAKLAQCRAALAEGEARLQELGRYYQEYENNFQQHTIGVSVADLMTKRQFLQRLSDAQGAQRAIVDQLAAQVEQAKKCWLECHKHHNKIDRLLQNLAHQEQKAREKKEQKAIDDWVAQNYRRNGHPL